MRLLRFITGAALVPACVALTRTVWALLRHAHGDATRIVPPAGLAMLTGFALWLALFSVFPRPMRTYILAHELTHALWATLMGGRASGLRVSATGGSVTVTKSNFLVVLAPYFFPLYTVLVVLAYLVLAVFYDVDRYYLLWLGLVGLTWSFHVTFTVGTLLRRQSDIRACGHLFSYTVIYALNLLGAALWIVFVSPATLDQFVALLGADLVRAGQGARALWATLGRLAAQ